MSLILKGGHRLLLVSWVLAAACGTIAADLAAPAGAVTNNLAFEPDGAGGFRFDTGTLRGSLHAGGKSLGLTSVTHVRSGKRLDRSNGLFSHYRVFSKGVRYGVGAWDWLSQAQLLSDGAVEVRWAPSLGRPFAMRAVYRWSAANALDLTTEVEPQQTLVGFESFLATYFEESFTNAAVCVQGSVSSGNRSIFTPLKAGFGTWQLFPRSESFLPLISDGRWQLAPNPVDWRIRAPFALPVACRRSRTSGLTVALMGEGADCFAIAGPEQTEGHHSLYLSLFGRDLEAGRTARTRTRLVVGTNLSDAALLQLYGEMTQ